MKKTTICLLVVLIMLTVVVLPVSASGTPTFVTVTGDKEFIVVGESITFTISSDGEENCLWVFPTGKCYENVGDSITLTFDRTDKYHVIVETWSSTGSKASEAYEFQVVSEIPQVTTNPSTSATTKATTKATTVATTAVTPPATEPTTAPTTMSTTAASSTSTSTSVTATAAPTTASGPIASTSSQPRSETENQGLPWKSISLILVVAVAVVCVIMVVREWKKKKA